MRKIIYLLIFLSIVFIGQGIAQLSKDSARDIEKKITEQSITRLKQSTACDESIIKIVGVVNIFIPSAVYCSFYPSDHEQTPYASFFFRGYTSTQNSYWGQNISFNTLSVSNIHDVVVGPGRDRLNMACIGFGYYIDIQKEENPGIFAKHALKYDNLATIHDVIGDGVHQIENNIIIDRKRCTLGV